VELGGGSKKHVEDHMTWMVKILAESEVVKSCTLGTLSIPSFEGVSSDFIVFLVPYVWCISL
jgi:hypothetical protein